MTKRVIEYVASAMGMPKLINCKERLTEQWRDEFAPLVDRTVQMMCDRANDNPHFKHEVSMLYNGYTETKTGEYLSYNGNQGFKNIYVDSGGLQMVTLGRTPDDDLRRGVYEVQAAHGDFGMCFDEIPLEVYKIHGATNRTERNKTENKRFVVSKKDQYGRQTGMNIRRQVETFIEKNSDCKVIIILQGNNVSDFEENWEAIASQLEPEHFDHIGGFAVADTCIGNGALETCDMIAGWKRVMAPEHIMKHIHFLGVGSLSRFMPNLYLMRSGFVPEDVRISLDSTTHTSALYMGLFKLDKIIKYGTKRDEQTDMIMGMVYDRFEEVISPFMDRDRYVNECGDGVRNMLSDWRNKYKDDPSEEAQRMFHFMDFNLWIHVAYMVEAFQLRVNRAFDDMKVNREDPLSFLLEVRDSSDYDAWRREFGRRNTIWTRRIPRASIANSKASVFDFMT